MRKAILCLILSFVVFPSLAQSENPAPVPITTENIHSLALLGHVGRGTLGEIGWSGDGRWLFVETTLGIEKYDYHNLSAPPEYVNVPDGFDLLATHPVENWLVGFQNGAIYFWDFETENTVHTIDLSEHHIQPEKLFFDADGTHMAIVHYDGNEYQNRWVYIWDISDLNQPRLMFDRYNRFDTNVALLEGVVVILSWQSLLVSTFDGIENEIFLLDASKFAIPPDASEIFMIGGEVYNIAAFLSGENNRPAYSVQIAAQDVGFSTNGDYLVTLDLDRTFNVYDSQTLEQVWRFENISPSYYATATRHFFPHPRDNFLVLRGSSNLYTYQFDETRRKF